MEYLIRVHTVGEENYNDYQIKAYSKITNNKELAEHIKDLIENARTEQEKCCIDCKHFRSELHYGYPYEYCSNLDLHIYDMTEFYCQRFEKL